MDRDAARQVELVSLILVGMIVPSIIVLVGVTSWTGMGMTIVGCCLLPFYLAWGIWYVIRGRQATPPGRGRTGGQRPPHEAHAMDRDAWRLGELVVLILIGVGVPALIALAVSTESWEATGRSIICSCCFTPLYPIWVGWFAARGLRATPPDRGRTGG